MYQLRGKGTKASDPLLNIPYMTKRILIAEDHPVVVASLEDALQNNDFRVVGVSKRWDRVADDYASLRPDVCLIDVHMPPEGGTGLDAARHILLANQKALVVCISAMATPALVSRATDIGCKGFISKTSNLNEVVRTINSASIDEIPVYDQKTASLLADHYRNRNTQQDVFGLTSREVEVLALVCHGRSNQEIAQELCISKSTAAAYLTSAFGKMRVRDRAEAAARAVTTGIVEYAT
jgi:DNA-binding NarL/FixJ family response regulator